MFFQPDEDRLVYKLHPFSLLIHYAGGGLLLAAGTGWYLFEFLGSGHLISVEQLIALVFAGVGAMVICSAFFARIDIYADRIEMHRTTSCQVIAIDRIIGAYRPINNNCITLLADDPSIQSIAIDRPFAIDAAFRDWLSGLPRMKFAASGNGYEVDTNAAPLFPSQMGRAFNAGDFPRQYKAGKKFVTAYAAGVGITLLYTLPHATDLWGNPTDLMWFLLFVGIVLFIEAVIFLAIVYERMTLYPDRVEIRTLLHKGTWRREEIDYTLEYIYGGHHGLVFVPKDKSVKRFYSLFSSTDDYVAAWADSLQKQVAA